jgi:PAS domain S-box-containing protein
LEASQRLLHELQVHQIELEAQNTELRQLQLALEASRAQFVDLYDLAPVGYCTVGETGLIVRANLTLTTMLGVARKDLGHKPFAHFINLEDQGIFYRLRQRLLEPLTVVPPSPSAAASTGRHAARTGLKTIEPGSCELRMIKGSGTPFWALLSATLAPAQTALIGTEAVTRATLFHLTVTDISVAKQAETALRKSEARFRVLADLSADWYWEQDGQFRFVSVSERSEELSNLPAASLMGKTRWEMPSLGVSQAQWAQHQAMLHTQQVFRNFEYSRPGAAGEPLWVSVSGAPMLNDQGQTMGYHGVSRDITARKLAEAQLRKLSRTTEQSPMAIVIADLSGAIEYVNPRFTEVTGYSFAEVLGKNPRLLQSGDTPQGTYVDMWQTLSNGQIWSGELFNRKKNGEVFVEKTVMAAVFGADGKPTHYVALKEDITQLRQHEQTRLNLAERVQALSRALVQAQEHTRKRFAQELHDRTSPNLAALRINLDIIANASHQMHGTPAFADRVQDTRALIDDTTLSIREICAGLHPPALDRGGLLGSAHSYAQAFSQRTGLQVQVNCSHGEVRLDADLELALFRILQEALTNCAKHAKAAQVRVVVQLDTNPMQLSITDNGVGFDASSSHIGALRQGLGLVNMQETAEFVGATYALYTAPSQGTRIVVEIAQPAPLLITTRHP